MLCPAPIADILIEIIARGILRIRAFGGMGDARRCVYESDHIHNLPALLHDYSPQLLEFYWQTERPLLIKQVSEDECRAFSPLWDRLGKAMVQAGVPGAPFNYSGTPSVAGSALSAK